MFLSHVTRHLISLIEETGISDSTEGLASSCQIQVCLMYLDEQEIPQDCLLRNIVGGF